VARVLTRDDEADELVDCCDRFGDDIAEEVRLPSRRCGSVDGPGDYKGS